MFHKLYFFSASCCYIIGPLVKFFCDPKRLACILVIMFWIQKFHDGIMVGYWETESRRDKSTEQTDGSFQPGNKDLHELIVLYLFYLQIFKNYVITGPPSHTDRQTDRRTTCHSITALCWLHATMHWTISHPQLPSALAAKQKNTENTKLMSRYFEIPTPNYHAN